MIMFGSFLPGLGWLAQITKVYSGLGADIVMESITLKPPAGAKTGGFECYGDFSTVISRGHGVASVEPREAVIEATLRKEMSGA
jgi:hypothetical protein